MRAEQDSQIKCTSEGATSECDSALQPAWTGKFRVDRCFAQWAFGVR